MTVDKEKLRQKLQFMRQELRKLEKFREMNQFNPQMQGSNIVQVYTIPRPTLPRLCRPALKFFAVNLH